MPEPQQSFYDPALDGLAQDMQIVLKPKPFKPLYNVKTGKWFSYSFAAVMRNESANTDNDIAWLNHEDKTVPKEIRDKTAKLKQLHAHMVGLHKKRDKAAKFKNEERVEELTEEIEDFKSVIDECIYPKSEREYVESKEAERYRLEQQNELKLDQGSIDALKSASGPAPGSTSDDSVLKAKLENAEKRMIEMQKLIDAQAQTPHEQQEESVGGINLPPQDTVAKKPTAKRAPRKKQE